MTEFVWSEIRDKAIRSFNGQTPGAEVEQAVLEAFMEAPQQVVNEIARVAKKLAEGKIQSAWPILRLNVKQILDRPDATVSDESEKARALRQAEQWIRTTGVHCPSESELLAELYGESERTPPMSFLAELDEQTRDAPGRYLFDGLLGAVIARTADEGPQEIPDSQSRGRLSAWAGDPELRERLCELWRAERPRGQLTEAEMETRAARLVLQRKTANVRSTSSEEAA